MNDETINIDTMLKNKFKLTSSISSPNSSADKNDELVIPDFELFTAFNSERIYNSTYQMFKKQLP